MKRLKLNSKGFSLVELICAIAILGATITVLLNSFVIGTNVSKKRVKQSEATLAGKNVLEAVASSSIDDFYSGDASGRVKELLGSNLSVSLMQDKDAEDKFSVALENLHAGGSDFDAEVEFSRGDQSDTYSDGLYLINSKQIKLAQYDAMDGVFCQPYEIGSNPDLLVEDEIKAEAYSRGLNPVDDLLKRERIIRVYVTHDPSEDWVLNPDSVRSPDDPYFEDLEHTGRYHYCTVIYEYIFTYSKYFVVNGRPENQIRWSRSYTVFPGGYEPQNKDGSISVYLMYYPVFSDNYASDEIYIYNNSWDVDGNRLEYWLDDDDTNPYTVALNTYLYCQDPYDYDGSGYVYTPYANKSQVKESIYLHMPENYNLDLLKGTYIYTNAKEVCMKTNGGSADGFKYYILQSQNPYMGVGQNTGKLLDSDLVRKEDKVKIYNIRVTLYKVDADNPNFVDDDGTKTVREGVKPAYTIYGTNTN